MQKNGFFKIVIPSLTVFLSSACIMIIELVASRLIAKHLGSSLYTWTSVIGVVLAGITIGNYIGGRIADKYQPRKALSAIFCLASVACVIIIILNNIVGEWIWLWQLSWPVRVFIHISLVFLIPSILLGTISPVVAKMALDTGLPAGRTVGDIYAFGAAGSIAGTFLAGFYLIAAMGTIAIIWTIAFILLLISIFYRAKSWPVYIWAILLFIFFFLGFSKIASAQELGTNLLLREKADPSILYQDETAYCYVAVKQSDGDSDNRVFYQDKLIHSQIDMRDISDLKYSYEQIHAAITHRFSENKKHLTTLIIGGGGYVFPRYIDSLWPGSIVEVAEIDPGVTKAAHEAFGLPQGTPIKTINLDARNYIDQLCNTKVTGKYDFIYEDALNDYNIPFQLTTKEFNEKLYTLLKDDGIYLIELIDVYESGLFLSSFVNTLNLTFPHVYVVTEKEPHLSLRNTFVVAASKNSLDLSTLSSNYTKEKLSLWLFNDQEVENLKKKSGYFVLTDDFAPVENLLAPVVRQSARELLAAKYISMARSLRSKGSFEDSISYFKKAADNNISDKILAYNEIGLAYVALNQPQEAIKAFKEAIDFHYSTKSSENIIGSLHLNLGILYQRLNDPQEAKKQFNLAIERFGEEIMKDPTNHAAYNRLGNTLATIGKFIEASEAFRKALEFSPGNHQYYGDLIQSLVLQNRIDEAIPLIKEQIALLQKEGDFKSAAELNAYLQELSQKK
jgi:tetratricopeptide (TPR) repeat protein